MKTCRIAIAGLGVVGAEVARHLTSRQEELSTNCLLYTSPSPRDLSTSRMPSSA